MVAVAWRVIVSGSSDRSVNVSGSVNGGGGVRRSVGRSVSVSGSGGGSGNVSGSVNRDGSVRRSVARATA